MFGDGEVWRLFGCLCDGEMERLVVCLVMERCRDHLGVWVMETWRD